MIIVQRMAHYNHVSNVYVSCYDEKGEFLGDLRPPFNSLKNATKWLKKFKYKFTVK